MCKKYRVLYSKIRFADLMGMVSYECICLSKKREGFTLHLFPQRSPNRIPISGKSFEQKKKPSPK